jgi:hypothetical protein
VRDRDADLADLALLWVGRSKAIERPVWPRLRFLRKSSFEAAAVEWPA